MQPIFSLFKHIFTMSVLYSVVTPYNHSTYYYNELLNSGRQVGDSFYAYVRGGGLLLSVGFEGALLYFLAPSDDSSSFCRLR